MVEIFLGRKIFDFLVEKKSLKKSMKIQNFEISIFFEHFSKFQNFEFSLTFSTKFFSTKKPKTFGPKNCSIKKFSIFFRRKMFRPKNFRSPIPIPNFPKIPKIMLRKPCDDSKQTKTPKIHLSYFFFTNLRRTG